jgi:hypothetical protein
MREADLFHVKIKLQWKDILHYQMYKMTGAP